MICDILMVWWCFDECLWIISMSFYMFEIRYDYLNDLHDLRHNHMIFMICITINTWVQGFESPTAKPFPLFFFSPPFPASLEALAASLDALSTSFEALCITFGDSSRFNTYGSFSSTADCLVSVVSSSQPRIRQFFWSFWIWFFSKLDQSTLGSSTLTHATPSWSWVSLLPAAISRVFVWPPRYGTCPTRVDVWNALLIVCHLSLPLTVAADLLWLSPTS